MRLLIWTVAPWGTTLQSERDGDPAFVWEWAQSFMPNYGHVFVRMDYQGVHLIFAPKIERVNFRILGGDK